MYIRINRQSRKAPRLDKLADMSQAEASKYGPYGRDDSPCTVECGGKRTEWKSRRAARFFYSVAAVSCEGSEAERYSSIVADLEAGNIVASDGIQIVKERNIPYARGVEREVSALRIRQEALEGMIAECRAKGLNETALRLVEQWGDVSREISRLEKGL